MSTSEIKNAMLIKSASSSPCYLRPDGIKAERRPLSMLKWKHARVWLAYCVYLENAYGLGRASHHGPAAPERGMMGVSTCPGRVTGAKNHWS